MPFGSNPTKVRKVPQVVRKDRQPEVSNRAIAEAIGVSAMTVGRDLHATTNVAPEAPLPVASPDEDATNVAAMPDDDLHDQELPSLDLPLDAAREVDESDPRCCRSDCGLAQR